jgi:HK97 gp10 family phage protein
MAVDIKFTDNSDKVLDELKRRIPIILEALGIEAEGNAITEVNTLVYDSPESKTYVRTGFLKNSITHAVSGKSAAISTYHSNLTSTGEDAATGKTGAVKIGRYSGTIGAVSDQSVYIGTNVEYASYVELGTSKMAPRPFLKNAIENYKNDYKRIVEDGLK